MFTSHNNNRNYRNSSTQSLHAIVGSNVQRIRNEQSLTVTSLSHMTSLSRPMIAKIEGGNSDLRLSHLQKIADALCIDPIELLLPPKQ